MVPDTPVTLIPNGVDRERFRPDPVLGAAFRERYGIDEEERVVLSVAQMTPRKGIYDFFALAALHPEIRFVWIGGLPYSVLSKDYARITALRERAGPNVLFTGYVERIEAPYAAADAFFMGSHAETFGLVILEALASGLPVIARSIPEFREIFGPSVLYFSTVEEAGSCSAMRRRSPPVRPAPARRRLLSTSARSRRGTPRSTARWLDEPQRFSPPVPRERVDAVVALLGHRAGSGPSPRLRGVLCRAAA